MTWEQTVAEKLLEIARTALAQTRESKVNWRQMDDEFSFLFSGSKSSLIVDLHPREDRYELRLLNPRGTVVESLVLEKPVTVTDPWGDKAPIPPSDAEVANWELLRDLHEMARRNALDIDNLMDAALADLTTAPEEPPF